MRFEDERYVRIFTRDTMTWLMLPWQSKCVLPLVARKLDRAGVLDMGEHGLAGLAVMIQVPGDIVEPGILGATAAHVLEIRDSLLVWPRFLEAQEAKQSDRARARASRERARDVSRAESHGVTVASQNVTEPTAGERERHTASHAVTPYLAVPYLAVPELKNTSVPPTPPEVSPSTPSEPSPPKGPDHEREVFEHWLDGWRRVVHGTRLPKLDAKRRGKIRARLREGFTIEELKLACDGIWETSWNVENQQYDVELVCRDSAHVERFRDSMPQKRVVLALAPAPDAVPGNGPKITAEDARRIQLEVFGETMAARVKTI